MRFTFGERRAFALLPSASMPAGQEQRNDTAHLAWKNANSHDDQLCFLFFTQR
jgi:hypothetical protein